MTVQQSLSIFWKFCVRHPWSFSSVNSDNIFTYIRANKRRIFLPPFCLLDNSAVSCVTYVISAYAAQSISCVALWIAAVLICSALPKPGLAQQIKCKDKQCHGHAGACLKLMIAALLIALKPISVLSNWAWLLWGQLYRLAHGAFIFLWWSRRCFYFGWPPVWPWMITSSSCSIFYFQFRYFYDDLPTTPHCHHQH